MTSQNARLSQRQQVVIDFLLKQKKAWTTIGQLCFELDLTSRQVSNALDQSQAKGWQVEKEITAGSSIRKYRLVGDAPAQGFVMRSRSVKATAERLLVEMNQIRIRANDLGVSELETLATNALQAAGLEVEK